MENQLSPSAYYEDEQEINLVSLIFSVLHQYRIIIVAAVLCAVVAFAGMGAYESLQRQRALEKGEEYITSAQKRYNEDLAEYLDEKTENTNKIHSYENQLTDNERNQRLTEEDIANAEEYIEKSILNSIDPYNVYTADAKLYVTTDYKIMPGMDYQNKDYTDAILSAYNTQLTTSDTIVSIAGKLNTEEKYLRELLSIWYDANTRILSISVEADSAETAGEILDELLAVVDSSTDNISSVVGSHTISLLSRTSSTTVSTSLRDSQQATTNNLQALNDSLKNLQNNHGMIEENIQSLQAANDTLEEPEELEEGDDSPFSKKYAVLGFAAGAFIAAAYAAIKFLAAGRVHSAADLKDNCRLAIIGALAGEGIHKAKGIDAWLYRLEKRPSPAADDEMLHLIASTVSSRAPQAESVLLTGDLPAERLDALCGALQASGELGGKKLAASESILKSAATVSKAMAADAIVLVADCAVTTYNSVNSQAEQLRNLGKGILGCIVYE